MQDNCIRSVKTMIENLRSENVELRLSSMQGIRLIASTLGPQRTREELLLYLTDYLDDNGEVLRVFASALGTMWGEVGGAGYIQSLLSPLELLCGLEEVTVRDEAVQSVKLICKHVFTANGAVYQRAQKDVESLIHRLSKSTPPCRSSACALIGSLYAATSSLTTKEQLRNLFGRLVVDDEIMVRRAACVAIQEGYAEALGPSDLSSVLPYLRTFSKDFSDGIRLRAVTTCAAVLQLINRSQRGSILLLISEQAEDTSWRVRYMLADTLGALANTLSSSPDVDRYVVPIFRNLCQDQEPEVRAYAVYNMANVLRACSDTASKRDVLMTGAQLLNDSSPHVRESLANAVLRSVAHVPKDLWPTTILPTCTALLHDDQSDVRLALVSGFSSMGTTEEAKELAPRLVEVVIELAVESQWRLREIVLKQVSYIITSLESAAGDVLNICEDCLTDRVAAIREAAAQSCCKLVTEKGIDWSIKVLFPKIFAVAEDKNYLYRISICHFFAALADVAAVDLPNCQQTIWPVLNRMRLDPVPNVRMNVVKAVGALLASKKLDPKEANGLLHELENDTCVDVRDEVQKILSKKK